jgi:hypothetical protein
VRTCLAPTPTLPTVQLTAIAQGQTSIALQAVYPGIPFAATYNFESAASVGGPFTSLINQPANQYTDISLSPSTTRFYRVRMQFRQPQQGGLFTGYSTVASATTAAMPLPPPTGKIKPFSGHWIYIDQGISFDAQFARMQFLIGRCPHVVGYQFLWKWANLENPNVPGDYSGNWAPAGQAGFQLVKRFADAAAAAGKKIHVNNFSYGGNVGAPNSAGTNFLADQMPNYMAGSPTSPYGPNTAASNGINGALWQNCYPQTFSNVRSFMRFWVPAVQARLFALSGGLAAQFDTHPGFGAWSPLSESALPLSGISYSQAAGNAFALGPNGCFAVMRQQWPNTPLRFWANFLDTYDSMSTWTNEAVKYKWIVGGPDTLNSPFDVHNANTGTRLITSDQVWQGRNSDNSVNPNYTNWVNQGAWGADVEPLDLDTSHDDGVNLHHVMHANKLGGMALFWYDLRWNSSNSTPPQNRTDTPSPNLLDWIESCAQGGNVNVNGAVAGIRLTNDTLYPPTW